MNAIIKISANEIGAQTIQTTSARELHAFLDVGKVFAAWIQERIEQYGFTEGQDFAVFSDSGNNPLGGRPSKEYHITLDMAKELAMVERNAKGKQARQYFIECERQAKSGRTVVLTPLKAAAEAAKAMPPLVRAGRLLGLDKNAAAIAANNAIYQATQVNLMQQLGATHLEAEAQDSQWYTPTELGKLIGTSARGANLLLAESGLQMKMGEKWEATEVGQEFSRLFDTSKKHHSGVPVTQLKWSRNVLPMLGEQREAA